MDNKSYQDGYRAGRKRQKTDIDRELMQLQRDNFRRDVYKTVFANLMANASGHNWGIKVNGAHKDYSTVEDFAKLANNAAYESLKYF